MKGLCISALVAALALSLAIAAPVLADGDDTANAAAPDITKAEREMIELNKVLVIPQKCTPTDGTMTCDPNASPSPDAEAPEAAPSSGEASDADHPDSAPTAKAADADADGTTPDDHDSIADHDADTPDAQATGTASGDISNPDVPIPDDQPNPRAASATNDPNDPYSMNPEYGSLEDYQQQQDPVVAPGDQEVGPNFGGGTRVYYPVYPILVGGAFAANRITTPSYRPPFGPPGPWLASPTPFGAAPKLMAAPHALALHK
jgi:hypothetical protein